MSHVGMLIYHQKGEWFEDVLFVRLNGFLPTFGDAMRMATETRRAEEVFPSNGVGCPSSLHTQKRQKICKLPRFTKSGQEPKLCVTTIGIVHYRHIES